MRWRDDVRRANETLDWIEARQGPLKPGGYARIETDVRTVRAMAEGQDDERISEIRARHVADGDPGDPHCAWCSGPDYPIWPCDVADLVAVIDAQRAIMDAQGRVSEQHRKRVQELSERLDALTAERDVLRVERDIARRVERESSAAAEAWQAEAVKVRTERDAVQAAWSRDKALYDQAIDHHMARWKQAEAERDALRARAERAELANTAGRRYLDAADKMYALRAWDGNGKVMRLWGEWRAALAAASEGEGQG